MALSRYLADASAAGNLMDPETLQQQQLIAESAVNKYRGLLLVLAIGYGMICLLSLALVIYMRRNRTVAFRGDSSAARKIILPAYLPLLLMLLVVSFAYSLYFWILRSTVHHIDQLSSTVESEIYFSGRLFFMLLIIIYMYQKSVTTPALRRATLLALVLSTYNIPLVWLTDKYITDVQLAYWVPHCSRLLVVLFFLWVLVMPPERASMRTLREYAVFVLVYYVLFFAYSEMFHQNHTDTGFMLAYANILWGSLCPLVIWRVLKADTEHWRGLGRRAVALQSLFRQKHRMNERISSRGLHVLIEMHRKYVIDFAYLELKHKIGVGSSAVVFNGVLHSKTPVAVKVYSPTELTDELVAEFSHEAALCGALHHPNIVKFYGMCVCPPTICLVSELCLGSLDTVTQAIAKRPHAIARQQQLIDLNYMIDAARAVAYLHSFSPAFLHRDIKPSNFLVDVNCVVKLTDFGESRSLPKECTPARSTATTTASLSQRQQLSLLEEPGTVGGRTLTLEELPRLSTDATTQPRRAMTVRGTVEYMAPELIQGKAGTAMYGEAADIFSLAITLWDIAHPLDEKYPTCNGNHLKVFEAVLSGQRPPLAESLHPELRTLLAQAWDESPTLRPSALSVLNTLERIQRQVANDVAMMLADASSTVAKDASVTGSMLVGKMLEVGVVATPCEARRLGNGMMSAGLLHHQRHVLGFVDTEDERYIFDEQLVHSMHHAAERLYLPPISERQYQRVQSDPQPPVDTTKEQSIDEEDDDGESVFSASVGPTRCRSKADEARDVEGATASVAQAIGSTVSELLRFGPRRKLSRTGSVNGDETSRLSSVPLTHATSSQWANTTQAEPGMCPCKRLGAGMMYISKRGGAFHSGGGNKRFRRGKRSGSSAYSVDHTSTNTSTSTLRGTRSRLATTDSSGLTAKLLTSEFANTGDSATSEPSFAPTPPSASDVEMGFHVADSSEDEEDEDPPFVMGNQQHRRQFFRRPPASASHGNSAVV